MQKHIRKHETAIKYEDPGWLEDMASEGMTPVMLSDSGKPGDAESMWDGKREIDLPDDGYIKD